MHQKPRSCKTIAELYVGDRIQVPYSISDDDVLQFARLSGDWNPVHFDEEYASQTMFKRRIAHGMISVAKFSGIFGMDLPGLGTLWEHQEVRFLAPVYLNEPYVAVAEVQSIERKRAIILTWIEDMKGDKVIEGIGTVIPILEPTRRKLRL